ncbi:hypothetical protein DNTS_005740 [Danionella cerebrum]|uniref:Uncharacterized protein n=1 Tax=Danionella cerebrum TaxID=2873325 RepID=A0A553QUK4_9TELE|nr:hypothetical protein DNTS_005740 [Danionella translucida]
MYFFLYLDAEAIALSSLSRRQLFNISQLLCVCLSNPEQLGSLHLVNLRNQPYRRADAVRRSGRRRFDDQNLRPINSAEMVM